MRANIEGLALHSSLLKLVIIENESILLYRSMFATCFGFVEVMDTHSGKSNKCDERSMV